MEEFLNIRWGVTSPSQLERDPDFVSKEGIANSYVFLNFDTPLVPKKCIVEKQHNEKAEKKFVPGKVWVHKSEIVSSLSKWQQIQCLAALKLCQSGKNTNALTENEKFSLRIFNKLKPKIYEENAKYLEFVKDEWGKISDKPVEIKQSIRNFAYHCWARELSRVMNYAQLYKESMMLPLSYQDSEAPVEMTHLQNVLEVGTLAKFLRPSLKVRCTFKVSSLPNLQDSKFIPSKLTVSQDLNIDKILQTHSVDVIISSSGLKRLIDITDYNTGWDMPVIIKRHRLQLANGTIITRNIVYIDKPLPKRNPTDTEFTEKCHKLLIKTNLCQSAGFSFPEQELPFSTNNLVTQNNTDLTSSLTGSIADHLEADELSGTEDTEKPKNKNRRTIHHNVSYRVWNLKQTVEQHSLMKNQTTDKDIKVLIRCKLDACDMLSSETTTLQPLTVVPNMEYQLEYGGRIATKSELAKQWTSLYFRPFSSLVRVRLNPSSAEVVAVENHNLQKINNEAIVNYQFKPHLGLGVLYKIFVELLKQEPGNYLLHHLPKHGSFVALLKETEFCTLNAYDIHSEYSLKNCDPVNANKPWCPIDVNLILPTHELYNQMPGTFKKAGKQYMKLTKAKKKKKKKSKTKAKDNDT